LAEDPRSVRFGAAAVDLGKLESGALERAVPGWRELPEETLRARLISQGALTPESESEVLAAMESADDSSARTLRAVAALTALGNTPGWLAGADSLPGTPEMPGRYQRIREYGRGGMGRVMLVHDSVLARDIAVKELYTGQTGDSMLHGVQESQASTPMVARFLQEARITGQLEHPGIVPVYELGHREDGTVYYSMKLVRGRTLSECIREAATLQKRLALLPHFVNLCQAIAYAHSRGVLHRDIKPGNIMLGEFGETVVLDWGLAKPKDWDEAALGDSPALSGGQETSGKIRLGAESSSGKTAYGEALGTPAYMAPEQACGDLDRIDERSDVYSLGMVLFELLAGRLPFEGESIQELLARAITGGMPHIHQFEPKVPVDLAAICRRALSKEPDKRYQSAKNLADEVQRFLSGALVEAYTYSWGERLKRFLRTYWLPLGILAAAAALVAFIGTGAFYRVVEERNRAVLQEQAAVAAKQAADASRNDAEAARSVAEASEQRAEDAERAARRGLFQSNLSLARHYITSGDYAGARRALESAPPEHRHWAWGYLAAEANPEWLSIALTPGDTADRYNAFDVNPPRGLLALHHPHGLAYAFDPLANVIVREYERGQHKPSINSDFTSQQWAPDGKSIVCFTAGRLRWYPEDAAAEPMTVNNQETSFWRGSFSGDGQSLAIAESLSRLAVWKFGAAAPAGRIEVGYIIRATLNRDGTLAAALRTGLPSERDSPCELCVFRVSDGALLWSRPLESARVLLAAAGDDILLTASGAAETVLWKFTEEGGEIDRLALNAPVLEAQLTTDGQTVAALDTSGGVRSKRVGGDGLLLNHSGEEERAVALALHPDAALVAFATEQRRTRLWDLQSGRFINSFPGHERPITRVEFLVPQRLLATGDAAELKFWRWDARPAAHTLGIQAADVRPLPGGRHIALDWDGGVRTATPGALEQATPTLPGISAPESARLSPDGNRVAEFTTRGVRVLDLRDGTSRMLLEGEDTRSVPTAFSPDGTQLAVVIPEVGDEAVLRVFALEEPGGGNSEPRLAHRFYFPLRHRMHSPGGITFSPDGGAVLLTMMDTLAILDVRLGSVTGSYPIPPVADTARLAQVFTPDGNTYAYGDAEGGLTLLDWRNGVVVLRIPATGSACTAAAFGPDGTRLCTGAENGELRIWDAATGEEMLPLQRLDAAVVRLFFSDDGREFYAWSATGSGRAYRSIDWKSLPLGEADPLAERIAIYRRYLPEIAPEAVGLQSLLRDVERAKGRLASEQGIQKGEDTALEVLAPYLSEDSLRAASELGIAPGRMGVSPSVSGVSLAGPEAAIEWAFDYEQAVAAGDLANQERLAELLSAAAVSHAAGNTIYLSLDRPQPYLHAALVMGRARFEHSPGPMRAAQLGSIELQLGMIDEAVAHLKAGFENEERAFAEYALALAARNAPGDAAQAWSVLRKGLEHHRSDDRLKDAIAALRALPAQEYYADRERVLSIAEVDPEAWRGYPHRTDLESALAEALSGGRLVLLEVSAEGSRASTDMLAQTLSRPDVQENLARRYVWARLNGPEEPALSERYAIKRYPTFLALNAQGEELARLEGGQDARGFHRRFLEDLDSPPTFTEWMMQGPSPRGTLTPEQAIAATRDGWPQGNGWRAARSTELNGGIDLDEYLPEMEFTETWLAARFAVDAPAECEFMAGFDDGGELYLDGERILGTDLELTNHLRHILEKRTVGPGEHTLLLRQVNHEAASVVIGRVSDVRWPAANIRILPLPESAPRAERRGRNRSPLEGEGLAVDGNVVRVDINKNTVLTTWRNEWKQSGIGVIARAGLEVVFDENGEPKGIRGTRFSQLPVAAMIGLRDGDVILSINGQDLSEGLDISKYEASFIAMQDARLTIWHADILRDGKPLRIEYDIKY